MPNIKAFQSYYYNQEKIGSLDDVIAPPYDIISSTEREILYRKSPFNIVRVILGKEEIHDNEVSNKYSRAAFYLEDWISKSILIKDPEPSIYFLLQEFDYDEKKYTRLGLIALVELVDFQKKEVLPHEETLSAPKADRLKLIEAVRANFSPIFSFYFDEKRIAEAVFEEIKNNSAFLKVKGFDGVKNSLWRLEDEIKIAKITQLFKEKQVFIADGHHRYETALNYRKVHSEAPQAANYTLMYFSNIGQEGLLVLPTYRLIRKTKLANNEELIEKIEDFFDVKKVDSLEALLAAIEAENNNHVFGLFFNGKFFVFILKNDQKAKEALNSSLELNKSQVYKNLNVTILDEFLIKKILKADQEGNVDFTKSAKEAVDLVKKGDAQMSFFLGATQLFQIREVALKGERMPRKSTYFYPKIPSGLLISKF